MVRVSQSSAASSIVLTDIRDQWQRHCLTQVTNFNIVLHSKGNIVLMFCFFIICNGLAYAVIPGLWWLDDKSLYCLNGVSGKRQLPVLVRIQYMLLCGSRDALFKLGPRLAVP